MRDYSKARYAASKRLLEVKYGVPEYVLKGRLKPENTGASAAEADDAVESFGPASDEHASLVLLEKYADAMEAQVAAGWLAGNGVPCFLTNVNMNSTVFGALFESLRIGLLVPEDRADEARTLLAALDAGSNLSLAEAQYLAEPEE